MKKGNKSNSIATKFSVLKAVYNKALAEGIFTTPHSPFLQFKIGRLWTATRKRAIRKEEVQRLMQAEIPADGSAYLDFARDIFLFSYLSAGINFKDIATLRYCDMDEERIYYARHKTSKEMTYHLSEQSKAIIGKYAKSDHADEDYIFPILDRRIHKTEIEVRNFELHISYKPGTDEIRTLFGAPQGKGRFFVLERVRGKKECPFVYFISYFNPGIPFSGEEHFSSQPLYDILEKEFGIVVKTSKEEISARLAGDFIASKLDIRPTDPILVRKRCVYDVNGQLTEYNIGYYRADCFTYSIEAER